MNLSLLSIETAEELQRFSLKKNTDLKNATELSKLIKEDFSKRLDYSLLFSNAYFATYSNKIEISKIRDYTKEISNNLINPLKLNDRELEKLVSFCVNLSDYSELHEEEIRELRKSGCFK